jgi:hypothetical protein
MVEKRTKFDRLVFHDGLVMKSIPKFSLIEKILDFSLPTTESVDKRNKLLTIIIWSCRSGVRQRGGP